MWRRPARRCWYPAASGEAARAVIDPLGAISAHALRISAWADISMPPELGIASLAGFIRHGSTKRRGPLGSPRLQFAEDEGGLHTILRGDTLSCTPA